MVATVLRRKADQSDPYVLRVGVWEPPDTPDFDTETNSVGPSLILARIKPAEYAESSPSSWSELLVDRAIVQRGLRFAVIVGSILIAINHGDSIVRGEVTTSQMGKMALTVLVPYCVSVISSISAIRRLG